MCAEGIQQVEVLSMSLRIKQFNHVEILTPPQPLLDNNHVGMLNLQPWSVMRVGHGEAVGLWSSAQRAI